MHESIHIATLSERELPYTTLIDALVIGAFTLRALASFFDCSKHTSYLQQLDNVIKLSEVGKLDQPALEELLFERMASGKMSPEQVRQGADFSVQILTNGTFQSQVMHSAIEEMYGTREPGKPGKIEYDQLPQLASVSARLLCASELFLKMHDVIPRTPVLNTIAFLAGEYPDEAARLAQYVSAVENALQAPEYKALKSVKSRASFIADAMAGAHWELAPSYARQKAEEARKLLKRSKAQEQ